MPSCIRVVRYWGPTIADFGAPQRIALPRMFPCRYFPTSCSRKRRVSDYLRLWRHSSRVCPQISTRAFSSGAGNCPGPRFDEPSLRATACEARLSGAMTWIMSVQPRRSNAQFAAAVAPSVARPCPQQSRTIVQPISVPGQPSGHQGPTRPMNLPVARSITENIAKPVRCHAPAINMSTRHVPGRDCTPPICLAVSRVLKSYPSTSRTQQLERVCPLVARES